MKYLPLLRPQTAKSRQVARIITLIVAMFVECCCGTLYAFGVISDNLTAQLGYTQTDLAVIVGIGDNGLYISQIIVGYTTDRWGPSVTSMYSSLFVFVGYGAMALTYNGVFPNSHFVLFAFYFFLAGFGSSGMHMASMATNMRNFSSKHRGKVIGLLMSLFGLSALIFSSINTLLFVDGAESDTYSFLLFMACVLAVAGVLGTLFLTPVGVEQDDAPKPIVNSLVEEGDEKGDTEDAALLKHEHVPSQNKVQLQSQVAIDIHGLALFKSRDFWMLFYIAMVIAGAGLMYINYVGKVVGSLTTDPIETIRQQNIHISLTSAFSCAGRLVFGFLSDLLLHRFGIRRRILISCSTILMMTGMLLICFIDDLEILWICTVVIGFAYGSLFSVTPTVISERFGLPHYGVNWSVSFLCGLLMTTHFLLLFSSSSLKGLGLLGSCGRRAGHESDLWGSLRRPHNGGG